MDDLGALRGLSPPEDSVSLSSSSTDIINLEDGHYRALLAELEADAQDLEGESWSVSVDQQYIKGLHKDAIKRQDVIYELIQTEVYHVRTLKLLLSVYQYELRHSLQMEETRLDRMFPQMDSLLHIHQHFLWCLRDCRDGQNHYTLGDILINQFSGEMGERMKESYGVCCSHYTDAVSFYKEQLQNNKKFQNLITEIGRLSIVRQLGVPECILLVTQRLTKYPLLVERILQNTDADSEEHDALAQALVLIRETISAVDSQVHDYERASRLRDLGSSLEPHSHGRLKDGRVFKREDLAVGSRTLLHEGTVNWQAANGWLKGHLKRNSQIQNYCLRDFQCKRLPIPALPERFKMSSITAARNSHCQVIWNMCNLCVSPGSLCRKDAQIMQSLTEKLRMFADMAEAVTGLEDVANHSRLLLRSDDLDLQQGETLLKGAITEVEHYLFNICCACFPDGNIQAGERPGSVAVQPLDRGQHSNSDPQLQDLHQSESLELSCAIVLSSEREGGIDLLSLSDSWYCDYRLMSHQHQHHTGLLHREHLGRPRGNVLLEQEKQRNMEKQREEMANFHKLQTQHRQEQARWEKERERHQLQAEVLEAELRQREEECRSMEEKLAEERGELERWRETYQQDLERLRESTRTVEKQKERLDVQMNIHNLVPRHVHPKCESGGPTRQTWPSLAITERPGETPRVPLHRESISPAPPKAEVPIHLISTTNQVVHKPGAVQQQIPTKLATLSSKGKEKSRKKGPHQRMHSAAQEVGVTLIGEDGGSW
uniref:Rho/rac guanine nucleotide exchange factor (GEF) 18a n=1 Tax=Hucho hucho TaxID=62062 RepID=A0A4W5RQH4_9TELE